MSRSRRAIAAALAVIVLGGIAVVVAAVNHKGKSSNNSSNNGGTNPAVGSTTLPAAPVKGPIPGLTSDKLGIATGVVLFTSSISDIDQDMAGIAAIGSKWVRTAVRWDLVEPSSSSSDDWSKSDEIVKQAQLHGLHLVLDINGTPKWARPSGTGNATFPTDLHTYAQFAEKLATRYRGKVDAYELGNEPNHLKSFAHPSAAMYEQVLQFSYPLIKAADPNVKVLTGGLGGSKDTKGNISGDVFLDGLYKAGAKPYFDGVSYHPYTYPLTPSEDETQKTRGWSRMLHARQIMVENGDSAKPIYITEFGAPTGGPHPVSQEQQAAIMYDAYRLWATYSWAGALCWFDYRDKGTDQSDHGNFFGLLAKNGQPKLALKQYEGLVRPVN